MRMLNMTTMLAAVLLAGCGATDTPAADAPPAEGAAAAPAQAEATGGNFDWDKWASIANESPCDWFTADELAGFGITGPGKSEVSATSTRCVWSAPDGSRLFSASVTTWEGGVDNLVSERKAQIRELQNGSRFQQIGAGTGTVIAIHRTDRMFVSVFPKSDSEGAYLYLSGSPVRTDPPDVEEAKRARLVAFTEALLSKYGL
ncbi:MAG TPA: DUF3558 family protein [Hyphomonas sp.]|nr:DUF3558 family protein [Hyphomonas sp.]